MRWSFAILPALLACMPAARAATPTTQVAIQLKDTDGNPVGNAAVWIRYVKGSSAQKPGKDAATNWEMRTSDDGIAKVVTSLQTSIAVPQGSIAIRITAKGFRDFEQTYEVSGAEKTIPIKLESSVLLTKLNVLVTTAGGKPLENADVVVRFVKGRSVLKLGKKIRTTWEMRTNEQGIAKVPEIPQGTVLIQVIVKGYQTFGQTYDVDEAEKTIQVKMNSPQEQYTAH